MKERFSHELPKWMRWLGIWRINRDSIDFRWGYFAPQFGLQFVIQRGSYFKQNYAILFTFGWGTFKIYLPFKTSLPEGCDMPRYGFGVHYNRLWLYAGGEYDSSYGQMKNSSISWELPFLSWEYDFHKMMDKQGTWHYVGRGKTPWEFAKTDAYTEVHPYKYQLKCGKVQDVNATCTLHEMQWHRKWFSFLRKTRTYIDIEFSDEIGERSGSWKGGCTGCSWDLTKDNMNIEQALRRMEAERIFD